jgi:hypothetical protein
MTIQEAIWPRGGVVIDTDLDVLSIESPQGRLQQGADPIASQDKT